MNRAKVVPNRFALVALAVGLGQFVLAAQSQPPDAAVSSLNAKADLVLSPEFCNTVKRFGFLEKFRVGKSACEQLPSALRGLFSDVRSVQGDREANSESGRVTVTPRFVNISVTDQPLLPSSHRKFLIVLEWTIRNSSGNLLWLQTVQGAADRKAWTRRIARALVNDAIRELVRESVTRMRSAPELASLPH